MKNMNRLLRFLVPVLMFFSFSSSIFAEKVRYYNIELIIFETNDTITGQSEVWPGNFSREIPEVSILLNTPFPGVLPEKFKPGLTFKQLPQSKHVLGDEAALLENSDEYTILLHTAWVQPGLSSDQAIPVHIKQEYVVEESLSETEDLNTEDTTDTTLTEFNVSDSLTPEAPLPEKTRRQIDGYVKVILSRYLHVKIDLVYSTNLPISLDLPVINEDDATVMMLKPVHYRIDQTRKMRSNELHYIDHPRIGVLVIATPHETE